MSESKSCWFVGPDNTGDITHWENVVALKEAIKKDMKDCHMVRKYHIHIMLLATILLFLRWQLMEGWARSRIRTDKKSSCPSSSTVRWCVAFCCSPKRARSSPKHSQYSSPKPSHFSTSSPAALRRWFNQAQLHILATCNYTIHVH